MRKKNLFKAYAFSFALIATSLCFSSCSNHDTSIEEIIPEPPTGIRFFTLNQSGSVHGQKPSISSMSYDGSIISDLYKSTNNLELGSEPQFMLPFQNSYLIAFADYWGANKIELVDAKTLEVKKQIDFGRDFAPYSICHLSDNNYLALGTGIMVSDNPFSMALLNIGDEIQIKSSFDTDFTVTAACKVGNKIIVGGSYNDSQMAFFDSDNITMEGMRIMKDNRQMFGKHSSFFVDKNNKIWCATKPKDQNPKLCCIDPETETIIKEISIPSASTLKTFGIAMSNDGNTIYVRTHEAFYKTKIDNLEFSDDPIFEHREHTGSVNDLKMTKEGTLLFIDESLTPSQPSTVYEYRQASNGEWERIHQDGFKVGTAAKYIYIVR